MTLFFLIVFWVSLALMFWTYLGYAVLLKVLSFGRRAKNFNEDYAPDVSLIVTAYNEEKRIADKLDNSLCVDYAKGAYEVIVVSDGSGDRTEEIVETYCPRGIKLMTTKKRIGKHHAQKLGIEHALGEIIIFTDVATLIERNGIRNIVRYFSDPRVGCVSGLDRIESSNMAISGEGAYVKYEMKIRELESAVNSLVGVSGSFFAARKSLCDDWHGDYSTDFYLPLRSYGRGYKSKLDMEALGYYKVLDNNPDEFKRKVRTVVHGIDILLNNKGVMNPFKYGFFSFQIISHKLIRWLVPFLMILALISNFFLIKYGDLYAVFFIAQIIGYTAALAYHVIFKLRGISLFRVAYFFVLSNLSILAAWIEYIKGERYIWWEATKR
jgi:cellulose synthase/poly-beta-1,6-N-acetylglucosamine synthase-like glycosyltransferase